jgi:hypothetical protein
MRKRIILLLVALLASCGGPANKTTEPQSQAGAPNPVEEFVPVEFGRRPPNTPMTSDNMPIYDTVTYCLLATRKTDTKAMGPEYEECIEHQDHTRRVLAEAIDTAKFKEPDIIRCAKASRTAYVGEWYCLNHQSD